MAQSSRSAGSSQTLPARSLVTATVEGERPGRLPRVFIPVEGINELPHGGSSLCKLSLNVRRLHTVCTIPGDEMDTLRNGVRLVRLLRSRGPTRAVAHCLVNHARPF